jgi:hypothetical protein
MPLSHGSQANTNVDQDTNTPWFAHSTNAFWKKLLQHSYQQQQQRQPKLQHPQENHVHKGKAGEYKRQYQNLAKFFEGGTSQVVTSVNSTNDVPAAVKREALNAPKHVSTTTDSSTTYQTSTLPSVTSNNKINSNKNGHLQQNVGMSLLNTRQDAFGTVSHNNCSSWTPSVVNLELEESGKRKRELDQCTPDIVEVEHLRQKFLRFSPLVPTQRFF